MQSLAKIEHRQLPLHTLLLHHSEVIEDQKLMELLELQRLHVLPAQTGPFLFLLFQLLYLYRTLLCHLYLWLHLMIPY